MDAAQSRLTWLYLMSEPGCFVVGHYSPDGTWNPESDHSTAAAAADRVRYLNGGTIHTVPAREDLRAIDIMNALEQLNRSERGRFAARQVRKFIEAGDCSAMSLDSENWRAIGVLIQVCGRGGAATLRNYLPKR